MDRCGHGHGVAPCLHELKHAGLSEHILQYHAVGADVQVALAGYHFLILRVVQVTEQHLVGEREWLVQPPSYDFEIPLDSPIYLRRHFGRRFDGYHIDAALPV